MVPESQLYNLFYAITFTLLFTSTKIRFFFAGHEKCHLILQTNILTVLRILKLVV